MASGAVEALLHVVWGALSPPGAGRWYFLLALRLLALAFARGAWRGPRHDLVCTWAPPGPPSPPPPLGLRRLCSALCYNRHFPTPMAALWNLSFLLALLPITLLRFLHPAPRHARGGAEGGGGDGDGDDHHHPAAAAGGGEGGGGEDKMAAGAGRRASGRNKMAARPRPGDESSSLMWMDESDEAARPRPGRESSMATGHRPIGKSKMAAWRHPANESEAASRSGGSEMAAWLRPPAQSEMAAGRCPTHVGAAAAAAPCGDRPRPAAPPCLPAASDMAAGRGPEAGSNMAARRRLTPGANMAADPSPPCSALPALPGPVGPEGRGRWRVWLGAAAAAMLAVGEGSFLWAVLWRQLPTLTAIPIGCHLPAAAPCPPLACALPARADKMAALLGVATSAAASLVAVAAAAVAAAARALRGRGREGEGPA